MSQVGPRAAIVAMAIAFAMAGGARRRPRPAASSASSRRMTATRFRGHGHPLRLRGDGHQNRRHGENGSFRFTSLIPADGYVVTFELEGLGKAVREGVHVSGGQTVTLDVALEMESSSRRSAFKLRRWWT